LVAVLVPGCARAVSALTVPGFQVFHGPDAVAGLALTGARLPDATIIPVLINGAVGVVTTVRGRPFSVMGLSWLATASSRSTRRRPRSGRAVTAGVL